MALVYLEASLLVLFNGRKKEFSPHIQLTAAFSVAFSEISKILAVSDLQVNVKFGLFLTLHLIEVIVMSSQNVLTYISCSFTEILHIF